MDKTMKLLSEMEDVADDARMYASGAFYDLDEAMAEYFRLGSEDDFLTGPEDDAQFLRDDMTDSVNAASEYLKDTMSEIAKFDKALMKLIQLRGKLAEEIGIPIGGKQWVRYETYDM